MHYNLEAYNLDLESIRIYSQLFNIYLVLFKFTEFIRIGSNLLEIFIISRFYSILSN